jgi:hypothetical protein
MIEKIKISELTPTSTKGLVIVTVYEGGVPKTYSYDLNNITGVVKGSEFAGFVPCSQYIGAYIKPFTSQGGQFDTTDQFFYILTGYGSAGFWDDNDQPQVFSQLNTQTTIVYWDGSQYNSVVIADNSIISLTETLQPRMVATGFSAMGSEAKYKFDMTRYPICVRTWSEFLTAMQLQSEYINIYVSEDITADNTNPTQIDIDPFTLAISISGCEIKDVTNLVLSSLGRDDAFRLDVNNKITLKSTYNPMTLTGDKGSITFNIDKQTTMNIGGQISSNFVALTNTQASAVKIYGDIIENYGGAHTPTDITGNITLENGEKFNGFDVYIDSDCHMIDVCRRLDLSSVGNKVTITIPSGYVAVSSAYALRTLMINTYGSNTTSWGTSAKIQATTTNAVNNTTYTSTELTLTNSSFAQLGLTVTAADKIEIEVTQACDGIKPYAVITGQIYCHRE